MSENESTNKKKRGKPLTAMSTAELREAAAEFDREFVADTFGSPTPQQQAQDRRSRGKRDRPLSG
jgi:hypothetical protein